MQQSMAGISIINVSGQVVMSQSVRGQAEVLLSIKDLLPGMYWIFVRDNAGNILHRQSIVKQ